MGVAIITNNALKITSKKVKRMQSLFLNDQKLKKRKNNGLMKIIKVMTR
jgi:hypothetical protein